MKKIILCLLAIALAVTPLAACRAKDSAESSTASDVSQTGEEAPAAGETGKSITWLSLGPGDAPNSWETLTKPIFAKYKEETGVDVIGEFYSFNDLFEVIEVKIATGSSDYDFLSVDVPLVAAYATRGYISPMDQYFTEEEKAGFIKSAVEAGSWDGKFYAPPMNTSSQLLWYNKGLLNEAGVTVPENSVEKRLTWEQVEELATQTLDVVDPDRNKGIAGIMFQQIGRTYQMAALPNSLGEKAIGDDGFTVDGVINSEGWVKAMTWYQDLFENKLALRGITPDEVDNYFSSGRILFMVGGTWSARHEQDVDLGFAPCPAFEGYEDKVATPTGSWHFAINAASKNPDEAAAFIKWISLGEGNEIWLQANHDVPSTVAGVEAIINDPDADPMMKIAAYEAMNTAVPRALTPAYNEYSSVIDATFEDIRNGEDVKTALDNAVAQLNTQFERYKS